MYILPSQELRDYIEYVVVFSFLDMIPTFNHAGLCAIIHQAAAWTSKFYNYTFPCLISMKMTFLFGIIYHKLTVSLSSSEPYLHLLIQIVTLFLQWQYENGQKRSLWAMALWQNSFLDLTHRHLLLLIQTYISSIVYIILLRW